jgi:hypothetical protein
MVKEMIFGTIGGLGLFLYGMIQMSDGLKKAAGKKLKTILESMTKHRVLGCLVGAGVTALIQSSSATTVMIVGFVNAGLLTLKQAIPVIIGTNIGTTATAWLVSISGFEAFKITSYALPAVGVGFGLQIFGKTRSLKNIGAVILGFGILFLGISFMKEAFAGLEQSPGTQEVFKKAAENPILAIMAGCLVTMLIQSSSAAGVPCDDVNSKQFGSRCKCSVTGHGRSIWNQLGYSTQCFNTFYFRQQYRHDDNGSACGVTGKSERAPSCVGTYDFQCYRCVGLLVVYQLGNQVSLYYRMVGTRRRDYRCIHSGCPYDYQDLRGRVFPTANGDSGKNSCSTGSSKAG